MTTLTLCPTHEYLVLLEHEDGTTKPLAEPTVHEDQARDAYECALTYHVDHRTGCLPHLVRRKLEGWEEVR
ncbi:MAG: hypothetical protein AB7G11_02495 [Phycisphaerales bacterium]